MKKAISVILCSVVIVSLFVVNIKATSLNDANVINVSNDYSYNNIIQNGTYIGTYSSGSISFYTINYTDNSDVAYAYYHNGDNICVCFASLATGEIYYTANNNNAYSVYLGLNNDVGNIYYYPFNNFYLTDYNPNVNIYNDINAACSAIKEYLLDPPVQPSGINTSITIPRGNIAYIEINQSNFDGYSAYTTMPSNSDLGFNVSSNTVLINQYWPLANQKWGFASSLPNNGDDINISSLSFIPWEKGSGTNILGQTQNAVASPIGPFSASQYLVIFNPYYQSTTALNEIVPGTLNNNDLIVYVDNVVSISMYQVTTDFTVNNGQGTMTNQITSDAYTGTPGETASDPITWVDPEGGSSAPTISSGNTSSTGEGSFKAWLDGVIKSVVNVFQPAHDAIESLSSAVTNFASWLRALYIWLPAPVLSILTSAISIAIVIGVIKVFI